MRRRGAITPSVLLALAALAGCGGSSGGGTTSTAARVGGVGTGTDGIVTGIATCDRASFAKAVAGVGTARNTTATLVGGGFTCADGWAVVSTTVGAGAGASPETMIFEAEGQFWIPKDPTKVCPSPSPVPASLRARACPAS